MIKKEISIHLYELENSEGLSRPEKALVAAAREMTGKAYAPYSGFHVGAAVLLDNGEIVKGNNQENAAYPSGLCAERVAVFAASALFPGVEMKMIAVSTRAQGVDKRNPVAPCGACRQVMLEYEHLQQKPIKLFLCSESGKIVVVERVHDLLPLAFSGDNLKMTSTT